MNVLNRKGWNKQYYVLQSLLQRLRIIMERRYTSPNARTSPRKNDRKMILVANQNDGTIPNPTFEKMEKGVG
jgi:hypothetical protein